MEGGWYHVTARRWKREAMFLDKRDHCHFLDLLEQVVERYGVRLHAYALMGNHYHALVETPRGNLSRAMQWLNVSYGMWHNRRWRETGPLLQGRYGAVPVEQDGAWSLEVSRYIHMNPVRIASLGQGKRSRKSQRSGFEEGPSDDRRREMVKVLRDHAWSSYRAYAGYEPKPAWLTCSVIWSRNARKGGASEYRRWLEEGTILQGTEESWTEKYGKALALGSEAFKDKLRRRIKGNRREQPEIAKWTKKDDFGAFQKAVEGAKGEKWDAFRDRRGDWGRDMALCLARRHSGMTLPELAKAAGIPDFRTAGKAIERMERRLKTDKKLQKIVSKVKREMSHVGT